MKLLVARGLLVCHLPSFLSAMATVPLPIYHHLPVRHSHCSQLGLESDGKSRREGGGGEKEEELIGDMWGPHGSHTDSVSLPQSTYHVN